MSHINHAGTTSDESKKQALQSFLPVKSNPVIQKQIQGGGILHHHLILCQIHISMQWIQRHSCTFHWNMNSDPMIQKEYNLTIWELFCRGGKLCWQSSGKRNSCAYFQSLGSSSLFFFQFIHPVINEIIRSGLSNVPGYDRAGGEDFLATLHIRTVSGYGSPEEQYVDLAAWMGRDGRVWAHTGGLMWTHIFVAPGCEFTFLVSDMVNSHLLWLWSHTLVSYHVKSHPVSISLSSLLLFNKPRFV